MALDLRPNINIPPESMRPTQDPYNSILPSLLQGQQAGRANRSRQLIMGLMDDPALKADPSIAPFLPFIAAQPELLPQILPAMIRARALAMKKGGGQNMVPAIVGPNGELRADLPPQPSSGPVAGLPQGAPMQGPPQFPQGQPEMTPPMPSGMSGPMAPPMMGGAPPVAGGTPPPSQLGPGEVRGEMPFNQFTTRMMSQESKKDAQRKFSTLLTERTNKVVKPFDDALNHLASMRTKYLAIPDSQLGPAAGRAGVGIGAITSGRKFPKAVEFRKYKMGLITQLLGPLGVNRFNLQEVNNISNSLPSGTEDRMQGLKWIDNMEDTLRKNKGQAMQNLQNELMLYRAVMMPGQQFSGEMEAPPPQETPDPAMFEEP